MILVLNVSSHLRNKQLFNLFSLYGNIERILLGRDQNVAIISFESESDQMTAFHFLNGQSLYDMPLTLVPLRYPHSLLQAQPLFPYLNFLEHFYLRVASALPFQRRSSSLAPQIPEIFKRLHILSSHKRLAELFSKRVQTRPSSKPLTALETFSNFLQSYLPTHHAMRLHSNLSQLSLAETELLAASNFQSLFSQREQDAFEIFCFKRLPLDLHSVHYRNNKNRGRDGQGPKAKKINSPNRILYIFNLSFQLGLDSIKDLFEGFEKVQNFFYLNDSKNSALFHFENVQAACHILCTFKNIKLIDKYNIFL